MPKRYSFGLRRSLNQPRQVVSAKQLPSLGLGSYRELNQGVRLQLSQHPIHEGLLRKRLSKGRLAPSFIATLNQGRVFGRQGVVLTRDDHFLEDAQGIVSPAAEHPLRWRELDPPHKFAGRLAVLAAEGFTNYYHFLFDFLARYHMLQNSKVSYDKIYLRKPQHSFQEELLDLFGIRKETCYYSTKASHVEAEQLLYPSLPAQPFTIAPWVRAVIRNKVFKRLGSSLRQHRRLYVSRRKAKERRIVNEEELVPKLENLGFTTICAEELPVMEQARLFSEAEIVIGAHGAGLSNLVFCSEGTRLLEIFSQGHPEPCFWFLSQYGGLQHHCLQPSDSPLSGEQREACDIYLPWKQLRQELGW